jgi:anti-anti-sigma regulatory factor
MDMSVYVIHRYGDTALVAVTGEVDAFNYRLLESELEHLILTGARHILVDAGELLFCDIRGAQALERIHQGLRMAGGELFVVPSPTVARLFNMLWGAQGPEHPGLVTVSNLDEFPEPPSLPLRHAPVLRRVGGGRRARRATTPPVDALASGPPPGLENAAPRGGIALQARGSVTCPPAERTSGDTAFPDADDLRDARRDPGPDGRPPRRAGHSYHGAGRGEAGLRQREAGSDARSHRVVLDRSRLNDHG